jgi:hypothetical protein
VKGVVVALERVGVVEQQRRLIVHTYRREVADALALQAKYLREESCSRRFVANRNDGVVEDDRHGMLLGGCFQIIAEYTAPGSIVSRLGSASTADDPPGDIGFPSSCEYRVGFSI